MGFNEKVHAYIAAKFYAHLTGTFGKQGEKAFIHGTQYHAQQRGRRMAQLAIRNGEELNYATYCRYGEWVNTETVKAIKQDNESKVINWEPDLETHISRCPWHEQFKEMGLTEAGHVYCQHLDNSICRGFNPYLTFEVLQTLHKSPHCIHIIRNAGINTETERSKRPEGLQSFEYHCANSFWSYSEVSLAIFQAAGQEVIAKVWGDFTKDYGQAMADILMQYKDKDFNSVND